MDIVKNLRKGWLWIVPAALLLIAVVPLFVTTFYLLLLQIVVTLAAAYIAYILFTEKPKGYLIWGLIFIAIAIIYNPIIKVFLLMTFGALLHFLTALLFVANWYLVFKLKK